jgi:hypothetical protein
MTKASSKAAQQKSQPKVGSFVYIIATSHGSYLLILGGLDRSLKSRLLSTGCVLVNDAFGAGSVQLLGGQFEFNFCLFDVAFRRERKNFLELCFHRRLDRFVTSLTNFSLTKALTGA